MKILIKYLFCLSSIFLFSCGSWHDSIVPKNDVEVRPGKVYKQEHFFDVGEEHLKASVNKEVKIVVKDCEFAKNAADSSAITFNRDMPPVADVKIAIILGKQEKEYTIHLKNTANASTTAESQNPPSEEGSKSGFSIFLIIFMLLLCAILYLLYRKAVSLLYKIHERLVAVASKAGLDNDREDNSLMSKYVELFKAISLIGAKVALIEKHTSVSATEQQAVRKTEVCEDEASVESHDIGDEAEITEEKETAVQDNAQLDPVSEITTEDETKIEDDNKGSSSDEEIKDDFNPYKGVKMYASYSSVESTGFFYDRLKNYLDTKSIFVLTLVDQNHATYKVIEDPDNQEAALLNLDMFKMASDFVIPPKSTEDEIRNENHGELTLNKEGIWFISKKTSVSFHN